MFMLLSKIAGFTNTDNRTELVRATGLQILFAGSGSYPPTRRGEEEGKKTKGQNERGKGAGERKGARLAEAAIPSDWDGGECLR